MKGRTLNDDHSPVSPVNSATLLGHELGNVLHGLLGMAELLRETRLTGQQSQWLEAIVDSGLQMQALIQPGRFPLHRPDRALPVNPDPVDGVQLLERVLTSHLPAARSRENELFLAVAKEVPRFWTCDPCLIRQILDNVLGNALKFTRQGEVLVEVFAGRPPHSLLVSISDSGPGFGNTASGVSEPGSSGQGLGLYICRRIIKTLGGGLQISSPARKGTRIEISLPDVFADPAKTPGPGCSLFASIRCSVRLDGPMRRSVDQIMQRLGVAGIGSGQDIPDDQLCLEISDFEGARRPARRQLLLRALDRSPTTPVQRLAPAPPLETSLGILLLEMLLEWRSRAVRSDSQG